MYLHCRYTYGNQDEGKARIRSYLTAQCLTYDPAVGNTPMRFNFSDCNNDVSWSQNFFFDGNSVVWQPQDPRANAKCLSSLASCNDDCLVTVLDCGDLPEWTINSPRSTAVVPANTLGCPEEDPCGM